MLFELANNTIYINSGNSFSRAFLLGENFPDGKNLLVFDTKKEAERFAKILAFVVKAPIVPVFELPEAVDFFLREKGWFVTVKELFELDINWGYHTKKNTFGFEIGMELSPDSCITGLIDAGYVHSPHLSRPGSYKKDGDTISVRLPFQERVVTVSFFDTVVDGILIFDTAGQLLGEKKSLSLVLLSDMRTFEDVKTRNVLHNTELFPLLRETQTVFVNLDFWEALPVVAKLCQKYVTLAGTPSGESIDIGIREPKFSSLQDLETLVKNPDNIVHFYTKHPKVLKNFLSYNNLIPRTLEELDIGGLQSFAIKDTYFVADDILGDIFIRNRTKKSIAKNLDLMLEIRPGDYVVHRDHGVGIFREIVEKDV